MYISQPIELKQIATHNTADIRKYSTRFEACSTNKNMAGV
jgi:hypothetical protein